MGVSVSVAAVADPVRGVYDARRAAALAGVPVTTLHYWARKGLYLPSIFPEPRTRYWSWMDLLALRTIDWLRHGDPGEGRARVPISRIRTAFQALEKRGLSREIFHREISVTRDGRLFLGTGDIVVRAEPGGQGAWTDVLQPIRPYKTGPDLLEPRPLLRIIPGKLHGEPHIINTRITSAAIFALLREGYAIEAIHEMYPETTIEAIRDAIDLEQSLLVAA